MRDGATTCSNRATSTTVTISQEAQNPPAHTATPISTGSLRHKSAMITLRMVNNDAGNNRATALARVMGGSSVGFAGRDRVALMKWAD
jgi:hypothetical protein